MSAATYRARAFDGGMRTGLDGAELADTPNGVRFHQTPRGESTAIPQTRTPRRVRMRAGTTVHIDRYGFVTHFRIVEVMRAESMGPRPTIYGWRAADAVEVSA